VSAVHVAAVDLGASSGRVMLAEVDGAADRLLLHETARFPNRPVRVGPTLHWDVLSLWAGVLDGLRAAGREAGRLDGVGVDAWAVDYGLLDSSGALLGNPVHYRDERTDGIAEQTLAAIGPERLYQLNGLQFLPLNTIFQLAAAAGSPQLAAAERLLLVPDLLAYWLTGVPAAEVTNASTTGLLDVRARTWSTELAAEVGLDHELLADLREPGERLGDLLPAVLDQTGLEGPVPVLTVGSHDTASAVVGVPASVEGFAYVSCGTWSLVGLELTAPVLTEDSRRANFTNELGVDGTVRYLRNVMGLWILQESVRGWEAAGGAVDLPALLSEASRLPGFAALVDPDDPIFLHPGDMPARIAEVCRGTGQRPPESRAAVVRCVLDSLALAYRRAIDDARRLAGRDVDVVHLVGGGTRNELLCQLTADACGLPVDAGPVESAALGNVLVQARALGAAPADLAGLRRLLRATQEVRRYQPAGDRSAWDAALARVRELRSRDPAAATHRTSPSDQTSPSDPTRGDT
jgi:rhamnulokinase